MPKTGPKSRRVTAPTSERMINIIRDLATFKFRTLDDMYERFYDGLSRSTCERDIQYLESDELISTALWTPPVQFRKSRHSPAIKVIHFNTHNLTKYEPHLTKNHMADIYDELSDLIHRDNNLSQSLSSQRIMHEVGVARMITRYVDGITHTKNHKLLFYENVSRSKEASKRYEKHEHNITIRSKKYDDKITVQPDALIALRNTSTNQITFLMLEYDNNTENNQEYEIKGFSYVWFLLVEDHKNLLTQYATFHGIQLTKEDIDNAHYRVVTTTTNEARRNKLLDLSAILPKAQRDKFHFNTFPIEPQDIYQKSCISLEDYRQLYEQARDTLGEKATRHRRRLFLENKIATLPLVSCIEE